MWQIENRFILFSITLWGNSRIWHIYEYLCTLRLVGNQWKIYSLWNYRLVKYRDTWNIFIVCMSVYKFYFIDIIVVWGMISAIILKPSTLSGNDNNYSIFFQGWLNRIYLVFRIRNILSFSQELNRLFSWNLGFSVSLLFDMTIYLNTFIVPKIY